jgi:two-component system, NtrC family, sensor kinase
MTMLNMNLKIRKGINNTVSFICLLLIFILPFTGVVYQLTTEINSRIEFSQQELYGNTYLTPLWNLLQSIPENKLIINNHDSNINPIEVIEPNFLQLKDLESNFSEKLKTQEYFKSLSTKWQIIKQLYSTNNQDFLDHYYQQIIAEIRNFIAYVGNSSNLILDPDLDTYYLMDAVLLKLPDIQDKLARILILGDEVIKKNQITSENKGKMTVIAGIIAEEKEAIARGMRVAFNNNIKGELSTILQTPLQNYLQVTTNFIAEIETNIIHAEKIKMSLQKYHSLVEKVSEVNNQFWYDSIKQLDVLLQMRIKDLSQKRSLVELFAILVWIITIYVFFLFRKNLDQRQKTELALRQAEENYRSIVENSPDGIFQTTVNGKYLNVNPALAKIYGYNSPEELMQNLQDINKQLYVNPERRSQFREFMERFDQVSEFESQVYQKNGHIIWISENVRSIRDKNNQIIAYEGTVTDISETKKSADALRESEERFRTLIANIPGAVYRCKCVDNYQYKIEFISDIVETITGYSANNFINNNCSFSSLIHPEDQQIVKDTIQQAIKNKQSYIIEYRMQKAGEENMRWLYEKGQPIFDKNGEIMWLDGVIFDITDRKEEEALRKSEAKFRKQALELKTALQKLKQTQMQLIQTEKMSSLGQLVAGIAHEINNPVNFIHGNINYAHQYINDLLELVGLFKKNYPQHQSEIAEHIEAIDLDFIAEDLPKMVQSMKMGTDRIRQIVLSLRNFSRLDEAEMKPVDINEGLDSTLLILQNRIKGKHGKGVIEIIKQYGKLPPADCYAGQLNQVFMNILSNSIDAIEDKYSADLSTEKGKIIISTDISDNHVIIRIKDNAKGIPEHIKNRLFDPFFTTKPVGKGTGLGLSISYSIVVEKHHGEIYCHSLEGEGTEFVIKIPISQKPILSKSKKHQINAMYR